MSKETKQQRFVRVVEKRVQTAINAIRKVGGCADERIYDYMPEQVEQILLALRFAVDEVGLCYVNRSKKSHPFQLSDEVLDGN